MDRKSFAGMDCSVAQCLEVVGEWWSMLIVRDAFLGVTRFDDFQRRLSISRNILHERLTTLVDAGVLVRVPYSEHPPRHDYRLTDKGRDLWPVLTAMRQWGDRHAAPEGPPLQVVHKSCGTVSEAVMVCAACGEPVGPRDVVALPGHGRELTNLVPSRGHMTFAGSHVISTSQPVTSASGKGRFATSTSPSSWRPGMPRHRLDP
jgi:DNA-binding HxlR family transcriptional regulator